MPRSLKNETFDIPHPYVILNLYAERFLGETQAQESSRIFIKLFFI